MVISKIQKNWKILLFLFLAAYFCFLSVRASHEYRYSIFAPSDAYMITAARHFATEGFFFHKFMPLFNAGFLHNHIENNLPNGRYTHYPSLHAILLGGIAKIFPEDIRFVGKIFAGLFSTLSLLFLFLFFRKVTNEWVSLVSILFVGLAPVTLDLADSLSHHPLDEFFRFLALMLALLLTTKYRRALYWYLWFTLFFMATNSIEYLPSSMLFVGIFLFRKMSLRALLFLLFAPILSTLLHLLQIVWEWGSFFDAYEEVKNTLIHRVAAQSTQSGSSLERYLGFTKQNGIWLIAQLKDYGLRPPILAGYLGILLGSAFWMGWRGRLEPRWSYLGIFFLSAFIFPILMPLQTLWSQPHFFRNFLPILPVPFILLALVRQKLKNRLLSFALILLSLLLAFNPVVYAKHVGSYLSKYPNLIDLETGGGYIDLPHLRYLCEMKKFIHQQTRYGDILLVPPTLAARYGFRYPYGGNYVLEECWDRRLISFYTEEVFQEHLKTLKKYRDEFSKKDPRVKGIKVHRLDLDRETGKVTLNLDVLDQAEKAVTDKL